MPVMLYGVFLSAAGCINYTLSYHSFRDFGIKFTFLSNKILTKYYSTNNFFFLRWKFDELNILKRIRCYIVECFCLACSGLSAFRHQCISINDCCSPRDAVHCWAAAESWCFCAVASLQWLDRTRVGTPLPASRDCWSPWGSHVSTVGQLMFCWNLNNPVSQIR